MRASFASGEPQAIMAQFLARRSRRKREGGEPA
jgi:hypothetical protein